MTIAIGALYSDGVMVAADSKVVFSDGSTDSGNKLFLSLSPERAMFSIADAAEDAHAAKTVAGDISSAFVNAHREGKDPVKLLRRVMGTWYRSYGHSQVPVLEFLVGKVLVDEWAGLYYLQPVITENLVCMPTPSAEENDRGGLEVAERRVLDRKAGSAKRNPVSAREEIALVNTTNGNYSRRSTD